jgi:hypothetical protein
MNKFYLVHCAEFPEDIKVGDEIVISRTGNINAAYYKGEFIGSISNDISSEVKTSVKLISKDIARTMTLLVETLAA